MEPPAEPPTFTTRQIERRERLHSGDGSTSSSKGSTPILSLNISPSFSTSASSLPVRPRFDDGSTPTQLLPAPCIVSSLPQKYKPLLVPCPNQPCARPGESTGVYGDFGGEIARGARKPCRPDKPEDEINRRLCATM
ncbi:hypothetical protein EYF80_021360 [Liparis tanakae]|uniref:Uncharacterized protein n=1 Tax=Liparis tanakae TaxID=230148 RepID=A0A4Z2HRH5_9TELE|nr:hypothetical protein EYF80_021360 [Liparis tanakae]